MSREALVVMCGTGWRWEKSEAENLQGSLLCDGLSASMEVVSCSHFVCLWLSPESCHPWAQDVPLLETRYSYGKRVAETQCLLELQLRTGDSGSVAKAGHVAQPRGGGSSKSPAPGSCMMYGSHTGRAAK